MAEQANPANTTIDARPHQLGILKLERRGMRPMALKVLNRSNSRKVKLAAVAGVAAMLVSLQGTSAAYASKLDLGNAVAEQSAQVIRDGVAYCDQLTKSINLGASEIVLREQITGLFALIDGEHHRLEAFADKLGARLAPAGGPSVQKVGEDDIQGGGGEKTNVFWLGQSGVSAAAQPDLEVDEDGIQGGGGEKTNVSWLLGQSGVSAAAQPDLEVDEDGIQGGGGEKTNVSWLNRL